MAGKSNRSATFFAQKKLLGKAHTSNLKVDGEELIGSNIQSSTSLLFGEPIPESPARTLYALQSATGSSSNTVEYIEFKLNVLTGTTYDADDTGGGVGSDAGDSPQASGPHTYKFVFPSDYEASSSNPLKGGSVFKNGKIVHETLGKAQLVPPFYSQTAPNPYIVKIYKDDGSGGVGDEIPLLDNIDWNVDYYNGILFLQDYSASKIPAHARAFAYVGKMADEVISSGSSGGGGSSDSGASYMVLSATGSLSNERVLTAGTGLSGTDGGAGNSFTMAIDDSVVATLSGSVFKGQVTINDDLIVSGTIISNEFHTMVVSSSIIYRSGSTKFGDTSDDTHHFTGSATFSHGISGSLTRLTDGKSYLVAGSNITITSSSNGQVTIAGQPGDITGVTAGTGLTGGGSSGAVTLNINDSVVATISGSQFKGNVGVTGSLGATTGLSGSLTRLTDGKSYLVAGSNITITSASNGQVTIAGQPGDITGVTAGTGLTGGGASGAVTLAIDDSVVATVSGTQFRGNIGVTGSLGVTAGLSGSLTRLTNGQSYLIAGSNVTITSSSNGSVTITSADTNTEYTAGDGLDLGGTEFSVDLKSAGGLKIDSTELAIDDSLVATLSGSTFKGQVTVNDDLVVSGTIIANEFHTMVVSSSIIYRSGSTKFGDTADDTHHFTGSASFTSGISGSLTRLTDGRSYLVAGNNVTIASSSNGQVTITSADTNTEYTAGDGLDLTSTTFSVDLKSSGGLKIDSTELAIEPSDFAGTGLEDDGSDNLRISTAAAGTGLTGGGGSALSIDDSTVATLSGSTFRGQVTINDDLVVSGTIIANEFHTMVVSSSIIYRSGSTKFGDTSDDTHHFTGSASFTTGLSGSLTRLVDGRSYLVAGNNVTITSASNGQVTIASALGTTELSEDTTPELGGQLVTGDHKIAFGTGDNTSEIDFTYNGGGNFTAIASVKSIDMFLDLNGGDSGQKFRIFNNLQPTSAHAAGTNTDTNAIFMVREEGNVFTKGYITASMGFSGSLTKLTDGRSYLVAGDNVTITSASNGQVTVAADAATPAGSNTQIQFNNGGAFGASSAFTFTGTEVELNAASPKITLRRANNAQNSAISFEGHAGTPGATLMLSGASTNDLVLSTHDGSSLVERVRIGSNLPNVSIDVTGSLKSTLGLSGSLTRLVDGKSYLVAGDNVTITSASNGQVTIASSGGGGSINVTSGSTSVSTVTRIDFTDGFVVNDSQGGIASVTSSIGKPEDGAYTDGLFTDFLSSTPIGTAIDRFNEVLKALAPSPAPVLDNINALHSGTGAFLSFGSSNNLASANPAYTSVAGSAGISSAADVNTLYTVVTSSNNLRLGIFDGDTHITGILNSDVPSNSQGNSVQNYPAFSFGDGDSGVVRLTVNGSTIKTVDLTQDPIGSGTSGIGSGSHIDANGSGFKFFSAAATGTFSNGNSFLSFKHRTGQFVIGSGSQRRGWNYARVQHIKTGSTTTTNYIEWVNDDNPDALAAAGNTLGFVGSGSIHLSGIEYFRSGTATYKVRVTNAYKNVYDTNNITFTTSNSAASSNNVSFSISAQSKPTINTGAGETNEKTLHITGSSTVSADYFLSGALTAGVSVTHPLKSNLSNSGQASTTGILMYDLANSSTALVETFRREDYRIISGAYTNQASVIDAANKWDSKRHMTASNGGHSNGLQFYNDRLYSPTKTLNSGDFRDDSEGGTLNNSPLENPDYSGVSGQRTFYRWFKNETGSTKRDLSIVTTGVGSGASTIVRSIDALNSGRIRIFVKFPDNGTQGTGWLDIASTFELGSYADNDGANASFNNSNNFNGEMNSTNEITLGDIGVGNNEYICLRIEADESWTGYVDSITVSFGAGTGTISAIPDLDDIGCNDDGTDCKLSFGASKTITGYASVGTAAGFSAVDINGTYQTESSSNNLRRSVFQLDTNIEGKLNDDVASNSNGSHMNHNADAFSDANSGSLKLEVNGAVIHEVEITGSYNLVGSGNPGSGAGTSLNSNGSGFFDLSIWKPAIFNNGVPDYTEIQRTGKYRVHTADQRNGWNYARVIHTIGGSDRETNYVEWVNDSDSSTMTADNVSLTNFSGSNNLFYLSGISYFTHCTASLLARFNNSYRDVYSSNSAAISVVSRTNVSVKKIIASGTLLNDAQTLNANSRAMPTLTTTAGSEETDLSLTASLVFTPSTSLPSDGTSAGSAFRVLHPFKSNVTTATQTKSSFLVFSASDNSNKNTIERFSGEKFRLISGSYTTQGQTSAVTASWDSTKSVNDASNANHYSGLIVYNGHLVTPITGGNSGDYRSVADGGSLQGPDNNVNYSTVTVGRREYYRGFENNTVNDVAQVTITLRGNATIKALAGPNSGSLGANDFIHVECKVPGKTGWLDTARASSGAGNTNDGDGALSGDLTAAVVSSGVANICTFNGETCNGTGSSAEYIAIRITAHKNWTGYLDRITVAYE